MSLTWIEEAELAAAVARASTGHEAPTRRPEQVRFTRLPGNAATVLPEPLPPETSPPARAAAAQGPQGAAARGGSHDTREARAEATRGPQDVRTAIAEGPHDTREARAEATRTAIAEGPHDTEAPRARRDPRTHAEAPDSQTVRMDAAQRPPATPTEAARGSAEAPPAPERRTLPPPLVVRALVTTAPEPAPGAPPATIVPLPSLPAPKPAEPRKAPNLTALSSVTERVHAYARWVVEGTGANEVFLSDAEGLPIFLLGAEEAQAVTPVALERALRPLRGVLGMEAPAGLSLELPDGRIVQAIWAHTHLGRVALGLLLEVPLPAPIIARLRAGLAQVFEW